MPGLLSGGFCATISLPVPAVWSLESAMRCVVPVASLAALVAPGFNFHPVSSHVLLLDFSQELGLLAVAVVATLPAPLWPKDLISQPDSSQALLPARLVMTALLPSCATTTRSIFLLERGEPQCFVQWCKPSLSVQALGVKALASATASPSPSACSAWQADGLKAITLTNTSLSPAWARTRAVTYGMPVLTIFWVG